MKIEEVGLGEVRLVTLDVYSDRRGFFTERFHAKRFGEFGLPTTYTQDNHSRSNPRVVRGLHFQINPSQGKLVGTLRGRIWDVAVDIRSQSPTFGQWYGTELSDLNGRLLWVPKGFAHGFCVLGEEPADVLYKIDAEYVRENESGILWNDSTLGIQWPVTDPVLSDRDQALPSFADYKKKPLV